MGVHHRIQYYDFAQLVNALMQGNTNMPNARDAFTAFLKKTPLIEKNKSEYIDSVLLLDEVDIFFDEHFYGDACRPHARLYGTNVLVKRVWKNRATIDCS